MWTNEFKEKRAEILYYVKLWSKMTNCINLNFEDFINMVFKISDGKSGLLETFDVDNLKKIV